MKNRILLILLFLITLRFNGVAQIYSFEEGTATEWSVSNGTLQRSGDKYKLGKYSICWNWNKASELTVMQPTGLAANSVKSAGGFSLWIYNTEKINSDIVFSFRNSSNVETCKLNFNLNFKGWRMLTARFKEDMMHNSSALTSMVVLAPQLGSGKLYFDYVQFSDNITWERLSDQQYQVKQSYENVDDFLSTFNRTFNTATAATENEIKAFNTIANRVEEWLLWQNGKYKASPEFIARKSAIDNWISRSKRNIANVPLVHEADGTVTGNGLYPQYSTTAPDGTKITRFRDISETYLIPLAIDVNLNGSESSKSSLLNIYDWYYDQGWSAGSGLGTLRFEKLRSSGYFQSLYLMRKQLGKDRFERELETLKWFSLVGATLPPYEQTGETADNIRTLVFAKLYYALMQPESSEAVATLKYLNTYLNNTFSTAHGFLGTFKSDGSGYHHLGTYFGAYYPDALYVAALSCYFLHDTPFALSQDVYNQIKKSLLIFADVAANYDVPMATCGRFPNGSTVLDNILPAFAYVAIAGNNDPELIDALRRLWKPTLPPLSVKISSAVTDITHKNTMGEIGLCLQALDAATKSTTISAESKSFFLPYSGLLISKTKDRHISIKGFSKYIWDFESSTSENLYGRYLSYGQLEYTILKSNRKNNAYSNNNWDWNCIPGTTVKQLSLSELSNMGGGNQKHRNFSDNSFLGGMEIDNNNSFTAVSLHDITFDKTFYAKKSYFIFGDTVLCLGSGINCAAVNSPVITTMFQQEATTDENVLINNNPLTTTSTIIQNPTIIDNMGNLFVVLNGNVNVEKNGTLVSAYIDHGKAPVNQNYGYYFVPEYLQKNTKKAFEFPFDILQQDNVAHRVRRKSDGSESIAIFDASATFNNPIIQKINTPMLIYYKTENDGLKLKISDPDLRRPSAANINELSTEQKIQRSEPFNCIIELKGNFSLAETNPDITIENKETTSILKIRTTEGKSYSITLVNKLVSDINVNKQHNESYFRCIFNKEQQDYLLSSQNNNLLNFYVTSLEGRIISNKQQVDNPFLLSLKNQQSGIYLLTMYDAQEKANFKIHL